MPQPPWLFRRKGIPPTLPDYRILSIIRQGNFLLWVGSKFILRSSKSHPLRQRAPLCTHSSFPKTFVTALTLRSGKNAHTTRLQQFFTYPADEAPIYTKSKNRGDWFQSPRLFQVFLMNCSPHLGQRILMRPFPRGTRTTCRQRGQVKYRFCRSRSLVKKRWKAAFSRRRASMLRE